MVELLGDGLLSVGVLSELGLVVLEAPRPVEPPLRVRPAVTVDPRGSVALPVAFGLFGLFNPVEPLSVDPGGVVGLVNVGVGVVLREPAMDEPVDDVGEQLTPGVIGDDGVAGLVDLVVDVVEAEPALPVVPGVPGRELPVVCANAGAVLKAIAHARPAPPRIGIFSVLISMLILIRMILLP